MKTSKYAKTSHHGFVLLFFLILLPIMLAMFWGFFSMAHLIISKSKIQSTCLKEHLRAQKNTAVRLEKLLSLNPLAQSLRVQRRLAQIALQSAIQSGNPAAIALAQERLTRIILRQTELDLQQRLLVNSSNQELRLTSTQTTEKLKRSLDQHFYLLSPWFHSNLNAASVALPTLPVRGDRPELAPIYHPLPQFSLLQRMAHSWQLHLSLRKPFREFFDDEFTIKKVCETTIQKEPPGWTARVL